MDAIQNQELPCFDDDLPNEKCPYEVLVDNQEKIFLELFLVIIFL